MQQEIIEGFQLSPQQKHLWTLQQISPNQPYRVQYALIIEGKLNIKNLENALQKVVKRHEILRTNFCCLPGMTTPLQVISDSSTLSIQYDDFSGLDTSTQTAKLETLFEAGLRSPLNLEQGSPLQLSLIILSPEQHFLQINLPSMNADTATIKNFACEVSRTYTECLSEQESEQPLQYADIAEWQNELLEAQEVKFAAEYWQKQNLSSLLSLKLPFEHKSAVTAEFKPKSVSSTLQPNSMSKLEALANKYRVSVKILLLACWRILLQRVTKQASIVVGTVFDGRKYEGLADTLGLLAKTLPVSCYLEDNYSFIDVLKQVSESVNEAYKLQEYFSWEHLTLDQKLAFFPVNFEYQEEARIFSSNELVFTTSQQYVCCERFKVKLTCIRRNDSIIAEMQYDSSLFSREAIACLLERFQLLLASAVQNPAAEIGSLEILNHSERQQLLIEFNKTAANHSQTKCIHQLFETQAKRIPNYTAIVFEDQQLTYAELNAQANQLARYLQRLGVGPEALVGIYLERSLELIVALLGILKAGGAYLPLDPTLPSSGLALRLQDAQVSCIVSHSSLQLGQEHTTVVYLDTDSDIAQESQENPSSAVTIENLVYVLFTSGSTGKPKGVAVEHQQLLNYLNAIATRLDLSVCNNFATISTFAADLGNTTIFSSLCLGGCLHMISPERASNPETLADYFHRHPIDCLKIVPTHLTALLTSSRPEQILPKQRLILGGEACSWNLIAQIENYAPECLIFNHYGPTEATVGVLTYAIQPGQTGDRGETVPIGRPLANTQVYLLDSYLQPVPIGVPGDLYIGGAGVARGYLNQPILSSEKFIPNPYASGERLYKTGDLARYLPDGNIEFIGRIDNQVKIHGYRIELGEIEAVLSQHPAVQEVVVTAREDRQGNRRLVVYFVPQPESTLTVGASLIGVLRSFLQQQLPDYMIPTAFVWLKALPLTPNGKVDRWALPAPDFTKPELEATFAAPRTPVEEVLTELWTNILGLEQVGIHDNFFQLGGDSILSMQLIAKANQSGIKLTPKQIFQYQTVAELATVAGIAQASPAQQGLVTGDVPLTPIQRWFLAQNLPDPHHWNQSILLECAVTFDPTLLEQAIYKLIEHHDALRLRFYRDASHWQQVNASLEQKVSLTRLDLSAQAPEAQKLAIEATANELQTSLNLSTGPLMRVAFFDLGADKRSRLLIVIHHLAVDGVSWRILLEDLQTTYQQIDRGQAIQLPAKTTPFQQWARRLQKYAQSTAIQQELAYWLAQPMLHDYLPVDMEGNNTMTAARTVSVALSVEETQALLQEIPAAYQTQINDVLLAALVLAYEQWTGKPSLLVDLEGHGREEIFEDMDLSRTVGWFTTIFPVLFYRGETSDSVAVLKAVKEQLQRIPNRGIGYGVLRYLSDEKVEQQLQTLPQAEIRFNYLGQSDQVFHKSSLFAPAPESSGVNRSLQGSRKYLLDINGIIAGGQLRLDWTYSETIHHRSTIESLAKNFVAALRQLIVHCKSLQFTAPSILAQEGCASTSDAALEADTILDSTIYPAIPAKYPTKPARIFLTGATGFLGAFLLYELLQQTQADIYCLVRSTDTNLAKQRILSNLESYLLGNKAFSNNSYASRIIPVVGDLSQPLLGLSQPQFQAMADQIDVIYHNGAITNLVYPYSVLKAANVLGTQEILRLASQVKLKPVHYISTLNVLSSSNNSPATVIPELNTLEQVAAPDGGYAQTKWVAEKLVMTARERELPICIYRLGRVSGHSQTGVCNLNDRMYRMIKGFIQLGSAPEQNAEIDMTPVDFVSKAIVHLSSQKELLNQVFHICNPHPLPASELFNWLASFGYSIRQTPSDQWQAELFNHPKGFSENALFPLMPFLASRESHRSNNTESLEQTFNPASIKFDCQNTLNGLSRTSIICPPVDTKLLTTYFSYLIQSGFIHAPKSMKI